MIRCLISGGFGFLGRHLVKRLEEKYDLILPRSFQYDLRNRWIHPIILKDVDMVVHLAGNVGGIQYNRDYPGTLFYDNLIMGVELMESSRKMGIKKFLTVGTVCAYPKYTPVPFKEEDLWNGYPEETNAPYGLAKKMLLVQGQAYRKQYGFNAIYLLPVNLYGPGDHYEEEKSHVIPALIKKYVEAKEKNFPEVTIWGTGKPTREFLYVEDAVRAIELALEKYDKPEPVNIGSNTEISISDLADIIKKLVGYDGKTVFDPSYPDGQPKRRIDSTRAFKEFGFKAQVTFEEGLKKTIDYYFENRKVKK